MVRTRFGREVGCAAERRTPNAKRQTPNAERRTPNAERRTPNAERRTPNAERRTPNAERRTPNAERQTKNLTPAVSWGKAMAYMSISSAPAIMIIAIIIGSHLGQG
jgi:hypothetical protein